MSVSADPLSVPEEPFSCETLPTPGEAQTVPAGPCFYQPLYGHSPPSFSTNLYIWEIAGKFLIKSIFILKFAMFQISNTTI